VRQTAVIWAALVAVVAGAAFVVVRLTATDRRGDLYAFDVQTGVLRWHERFSGMEPIVSVRRGVVLVNATKEKRCAAGDPVFSWFDAGTGKRLGPADTGGSPAVPTATPISVRSGVVTVRGRAWRASVVDRGEAVGSHSTVAVGGLAIVAVGGRRMRPCSTD
jgi:outer membrane protein assembly factor BamB